MSESVAAAQSETVEVSTELKNILEALIFASDEPLTFRTIRSLVDETNKELPPHEHIAVNADIIKKAVAELNRGYGRAGSAFRIIEIAGGYVHATQEQFASWVGKLVKEKTRRRLSATAVETLAIIAYKQSITKVEVEFIRGVNVDYIIKSLLEKDLIYISGRAHTPGRPLLYGTTTKFLEHFGLNEITDLPKPREIEELIGETEVEVDRRLLAEQQQLEFKEELEEKLEGHEGAKQKQKQPRITGLTPKEMAERQNLVNRRKKAEETNADEKGAIKDAEGSVPVTETGTKGTVENVSEHAEEKIEQPVVEEHASVVHFPEEEKIEEGETSSENLGKIKINDQAQETTDELVQPVQLASASLRPDQTEDVPESRAISEGTLTTTNSGTLQTTDDKQSLMTSAESLQTTREQIPQTEDVQADRQTGSEVLPMGTMLRTEGEQALRRTDEQEQQEHGKQPDRQPSQKLGWSKWKNKVKTFFQKLFG